MSQNALIMHSPNDQIIEGEGIWGLGPKERTTSNGALASNWRQFLQRFFILLFFYPFIYSSFTTLDSVKDAEQNPNREDPEDDKKEEGGLEKDTEDGELSNSVLSGLHDKVGRLDTQDTFSMLEWKDGVGTLPGNNWP